MGQRVDAVDAAERPEVDQHDLAAQVGDAQRTGIEPLIDTDEVWRRATGFDELHRCDGLVLVGTMGLQREPKQTNRRDDGRSSLRSRIHGCFLLQTNLAIRIEFG